MKVPARVECPDCGRLRRTAQRRIDTHGEYETGPPCDGSRKPVTEQIITNTAHRDRMDKVLLWAHVLRDEDPRQVQGWVARCGRAELEAMLLTALAAVPDPSHATLESLYGWVRGLNKEAV